MQRGRERRVWMERIGGKRGVEMDKERQKKMYALTAPVGRATWEAENWYINTFPVLPIDISISAAVNGGRRLEIVPPDDRNYYLPSLSLRVSWTARVSLITYRSPIFSFSYFLYIPWQQCDDVGVFGFAQSKCLIRLRTTWDRMLRCVWVDERERDREEYSSPSCQEYERGFISVRSRRRE